MASTKLYFDRESIRCEGVSRPTRAWIADTPTRQAALANVKSMQDAEVQEMLAAQRQQEGPPTDDATGDDPAGQGDGQNDIDDMLEHYRRQNVDLAADVRHDGMHQGNFEIPFLGSTRGTVLSAGQVIA